MKKLLQKSKFSRFFKVLRPLKTTFFTLLVLFLLFLPFRFVFELLYVAHGNWAKEFCETGTLDAVIQLQDALPGIFTVSDIPLFAEAVDSSGFLCSSNWLSTSPKEQPIEEQITLGFIQTTFAKVPYAIELSSGYHFRHLQLDRVSYQGSARDYKIANEQKVLHTKGDPYVFYFTHHDTLFYVSVDERIFEYSGIQSEEQREIYMRNFYDYFDKEGLSKINNNILTAMPFLTGRQSLGLVWNRRPFY